MVVCFAVTMAYANAQDSTKQTFKTIIDSKQYVFEPTTMTPSRGGSKHLTSGYFLKIANDTLKVYLPYIGRSYSASMNGSDAGFDFTSTNFSYAVTEGKKNSYVIDVKTKGEMYNTDFTLTVYDNATAYLRANNSNRQPVSYNGNIKAKK